MGCTIVQGFLEKSDAARVAWFAHRRELVRQAAKSLSSFGIEVGHSGLSSGARTQVVSVSGALHRGEVPDADLVFFDEAHHFAADEWGTLVGSYPPGTLIVGATATPERGDGRPLNHIFGYLIVVARPRELVASGDLVPCVTYRPARLQRKGEVAKLPVDAYVDLGFIGKRCVVFASNVAEATAFLLQFRGKGIDAELVHGAMPSEKRDAALEAFSSGRVRVIVNVFVLTEGWDCPETEVVMMARKCGSQSMLMQAVGRGLRTADGKECCHFVDLCGVTHLLGDPLEDRDYSLDGTGIKRRGATALSAYCICGNVVGDCQCDRSNESVIAKASGDKLTKFDVIRMDSEAARVARLAKWIGEEQRNGNKWQRALYRYRGAYGASAPSHIVSNARAIADGKPWCSVCKHSKCRCK
jgi:superfamily II DNA or RNA helicase